MKTFAKNTRHLEQALLLLSVLQVLCATYFLRINGFHSLNSIIFLLCGLGISVCLLFIDITPPQKWLSTRGELLVKAMAICACLPISYKLVRYTLDSTPLSIEYADMLPIIGVMCQRFLQFEWRTVYQPIPQIWNGIQPIYLPALWLPFVTSFVFGFDMRWITVSAIWLCIALCLLPKWKLSISTLFYALGLLALLAWLHFDTVNNVFRLTEEGVVYFYYSLMVVAIVWDKPWLIGICATLCLLSRYAIIGWIPFAALYLLYIKEFRWLKKAVIAGTLTAMVLVLPFGWRSLLFHLELPQHYIAHAQRVWKKNPDYFYHSLGMAKFFGPSRTYLLHQVLQWGTFIVPLLFLILIARKKYSKTSVLLSGFQLSITFFYNFLDVSYLYLYYTPVFVSLAIAVWASRKVETR